MKNQSLPITVCVTTKNNEDVIRRCLESVYQWVDEIVVLDSQSTDNTVSICEEYTNQVFDYKFKGFSDLKMSAVDRANNAWVLILDSDEWVPEDLRNEIFQTFSPDSKTVAYYMEKRNQMFGRWMHIKHPERPLLARKDAIYYENEFIHERLSVKDEFSQRTKHLDSDIHHEAYNRVSEKVQKVNQYASLQALQFTKQGVPKRSWFVFRIVGTFGYYYIYEKAFLDGFEGFVYSVLESIQVILAYQKISELRQMKKEYTSWEDEWLSEECER